MSYKAVGTWIINYAAPVWNPNVPYIQNKALRIATGCYKMSSIDHLHTEAGMLKVKEHSELLSAQYLATCLEPENICHSITTRVTPKRQMKDTLFFRHHYTVEPMMITKDRKASPQAFHTDRVNKSWKECSARWSSSVNQLLRERLNQEGTLAPLSQLRSGYCGLLQEQNQEGCKPQHLR